MPARSAVKRLPDDVRGTLEVWLKDFLAGRLTLDEVMDRLSAQVAMAGVDPEATPSRSAVYRYAQNFERVVQRLERTRELTEMLSQQLGPEVADGKGVQVMIQAVQSLSYDLLANLEDGVALDPKSIHDLAKATHHLASAQKTDADRALKIQAETRKAAAEDVREACAEKGLSEDVAEFLFERVLKLNR